MIQRQFLRTRNDGVNLYITFSDQGMMIQKESDKTLYRVAIDVESATYVYEETKTPIKYGKKEKTIMARTGRKYVLPNESLDIE